MSKSTNRYMILITGKNRRTSESLLERNSDKTFIRTTLPEVTMRLTLSVDTPKNGGKIFIISGEDDADIKVGRRFAATSTTGKGRTQSRNELHLRPKIGNRVALELTNYSVYDLVGLGWENKQGPIIRREETLGVRADYVCDVHLSGTDFRVALAITFFDTTIPVDVRDWMYLMSRHGRAWNVSAVPVNLTSSTALISYEKLACLGEGSQAQVFKVRQDPTGHVFAAKVARGHDRLYCTCMSKEADFLRRLDHRHIMKFKELHSSPAQEKMLILELCECTLAEFFSTNRAARNRPNLYVLQVISQMGSAINFLQSGRIIHRDIKCSNILVRSYDPFHTVLGDFGIACNVDELRVDTYSPLGTVAYMPPEASDTSLRSETIEWLYKSEVWSLGVVAYRSLGCRFSARRLIDHRAVTRHFEIDRRKKQSDKDIMELVGWMLSRSPSGRPTALQCSTWADKLKSKPPVPPTLFETLETFVLDLWAYLTSIFMDIIQRARHP